MSDVADDVAQQDFCNIKYSASIIVYSIDKLGYGFTPNITLSNITPFNILFY